MSAPPAPSSPDRLSILLVEDDSDDELLVRTALAEVKNRHFDLECASSLHQALACLGRDRHAADVILLDLSLPDSQGLATFDSMRAAAPSLPVLVLTGLDDEQLATEAMHRGAQDYILKGRFDGQLLSRAMRYAVERERIDQDLRRARDELEVRVKERTAELERANAQLRDEIEERRRMEQALRTLSLLDELTGLHNRRGFLTLAKERLKLARRSHHPLVLVFADLDGLKRINDTFGHKEGDRALIQTAEILRETFRESDLLARMGGDEFTALVSDGDPSAFDTIKRRLDQRLDRFNARQAVGYRLAVSVGMSPFDPASTTSIEQLLSWADHELYKAKAQVRAEPNT